MIIGIDPGLTGAIAVLSDNGQFIAVHDMPTIQLGKERRQVHASALAELIRNISPRMAVLEKVHSMPRDGVKQAFSFGQGYGVIKGVLATLDVPYKDATPQKWKKSCGLIGKEKDAARELAIELFPDASLARKKDGGRADALLIAKFG